MATAGVEVKKRTRETIRIAAAVLPMALVPYGLLANQFPGRDDTAALTFLAILIPWILLGTLMYIMPAKTHEGIWARFIAYHILAGAYILFISGFDTPFIALGWMLMLLISYIYLLNFGVLLNGGVLLLVALLDIALHGYDNDRIFLNGISVGSIIIVGAFIVALRRIQQADSDELLRSQAQEALQNTRIHTLINNLADAVININEEGKIEIYNAASLSSPP
jgi:PAS domain-containing protein